MFDHIIFLSLSSFWLVQLHLGIRLTERIDKDGKEKIQKNEIANEDPRDVEQGCNRLENHWAFSCLQRAKEHKLPILHREDLENRDESHVEGLVISPR